MAPTTRWNYPRLLGNTSSSSRSTCCNPKDKYLKTNLTMNCSNSLGLKTPHKRYVRSPIMVPVDYKNDRKKIVGEFIDIDKEPGELQDLIGSVKPPDVSWDFQKDFREEYNRTKQRNTEHPQGYYSTPTEKVNFTGGYLVKENDDGSGDVEDKIEKWKEDPVMYDMTGDGSDKDYKRDEEENDGSKNNDEEHDGTKKDEEHDGKNNDEDHDGKNNEEEEEVDLSDQFEDDKLEPPEFRDKFYKTRPYYKYLKYPRDAIAEASTENEKTPNEVNKDKDDIKNVTINYKPLNETRDVGFYRPTPQFQGFKDAPQPYKSHPQYRPYNDAGGMYVFRKRAPYGRNRKKIIIVNSPRKPKFIIRSSNCNGCIMPRNVVRKVGMPMYYYPLTKVPPSRVRHVVYPPKYFNKPLNYNSQPFPGDHRFGSGDFRTSGDPRFFNSGDFRTSGDPRFINSGDFKTSVNPGDPRFYNSGDFKTSEAPGDPRFINSGDFRTSGAPGDPRFTSLGDFKASGITGDQKFFTSGTPGDQKFITSGTPGDAKFISTPNPNDPLKESSPTRHQRHNPTFVSEITDPNERRSEIHIVRDTPGGYDDTVIYHGRKYVPSDLEISASESHRPDPFREVEDEYSERIEQLNDLIERETDKTSREIDREYDYWDNN